MLVSAVLSEIRSRLEETFGSRLKGVLLYGSEAAGRSRPDSDIDILVLLDEPLRFGEDLETVTRVLYPLQLEIADRPLHALPVAEPEYRAGALALYREARREGVLL